MKRILLGLLASVLVSALSAQARIGWTLEQCKNYYQAEISSQDLHKAGVGERPVDIRADLTIDPFKIRLYLKRDTVVSISYDRYQQPFGYSELEKILALNGGADVTWVSDSPTGSHHEIGENCGWAGYKNGQLFLLAMSFKANNGSYTFNISTADFVRNDTRFKNKASTLFTWAFGDFDSLQGL
jgi:hypothetical protein